MGKTCSDCRFKGKPYYIDHLICGKKKERQADVGPMDFLDAFRTFFDAHENQSACRFHEPTPSAAPEEPPQGARKDGETTKTKCNFIGWRQS